MAKANRTIFRKSRSYLKALKLAKRVLDDPSKVKKVLGDAEIKSGKAKEKFGALWGDFKALMRLVKAWSGKEYAASWKTILSAVSVLVYFVMPLDAIPDILLGFGYLDDVAIFAWALKSMRGELDKFKMWEAERLTHKASRTYNKRKPVVIEGEVSMDAPEGNT